MSNIDNLLYTTNDNGANIAPDDLRFVLPIMDDISPRVILEIGTYRGGSARLWQTLFRPDVLITLDTDKFADLDDLPGVRYLHDAPSQHQRTVEQVRAILNGRKVDLLFIDGGHLYDEVKADFEAYAPMVRAGGLILLHDIHYDVPERVEVVRYWGELKAQYRTQETPNKDNSGIGVIYV